MREMCEQGHTLNTSGKCPCPSVGLTDEQFDTFLDSATHAVADLWPVELSTDEKYAINDLLTQFFADRRP